MTAKILVNGKPLLVSLRRSGDSWVFEHEGKTFTAAVSQPERNKYHVILDGRSYEARTGGDRMDIDGYECTVLVEDPRDAPAGDAISNASGRQSISAPMPGRVVRVLVSEGDAVEREQGIVVIEAMKMQNQLKAPKAGTILSVSAREGATVAAGEVLAIIE
jgi:biotin carboxyl carrier protein